MPFPSAAPPPGATPSVLLPATALPAFPARADALRLLGVAAPESAILRLRAGRMVEVWAAGHAAPDAPPPSARLRRALEALVGWSALSLDPEVEGGLAPTAPDTGVPVRLQPAIPAEAPADLAPYGALLRRLAEGCALDAAAARLADEAAALWLRPGFESLVSLPRLRFQPFPHQVGAVRTVLGRMRGRAILADEVGLGKTIEAGLVLSELYLRRLAARTLILVPAGLVGQWAEELDRKFALPCAVWGESGGAEGLPEVAAARPARLAGVSPAQGAPDPAGPRRARGLVPTSQAGEAGTSGDERRGGNTAPPSGAAAAIAGGRGSAESAPRSPGPWDAPASPASQAAPVLLISLAAARRAPLRDQLAREPWDLVVIDEAHRLKNPQSASARLVKALRTRYLLLLTATPVENRLDDLFQLANLVRPGHLGTAGEFRRQHGTAAPDGVAKGLPALQARMRDLMVRHRRSEVALMLPRRLAETVRVVPSEPERDLYALVSERVRARGRDASPRDVLALRHVQRLAGSSPAALAPALAGLGWNDLAALAEAAPPPEKARVLIEVLRRHLARGEKVVVFTAFRATLALLADLARRASIPTALYHGSLSRREKDAAVAAFATDAPLLLTTEAAGEGRNLQFCHAMVNFDLPWNPMQIEQRLGRIHRIGQEHDVVLTNLATRGTVEDRILQVLEAKINLFELVVGELDMILGRVDDDFDFESFVFSAHMESRNEEEFDARLRALGEQLAAARVGYLSSRARNDLLVPEDAAGAGGGA